MNHENIIINCAHCHQKLRIPKTDSSLYVKCPKCLTEFPYSNKQGKFTPSKYYYSKPKTGPKKNKVLLTAACLLVAVLVSVGIHTFYTGIESHSEKFYTPHVPPTVYFTAPPSPPLVYFTTPSNWINIPYGHLVDKSIITHSGETVGDVIRQIPEYHDDYKGLVQQYLEPYSILCNEKLISSNGGDVPELINIVEHYPTGSEQPAWAALFREGHFQLYYNMNLIRVFVKGDNPKRSYAKHRSIIRLPILDVINSEGMDIEDIEVYVFKNDYANTEIKLNTIPLTFATEDIDLSPKKQSIDLDSIEAFLDSGVILEAAEVDKNNDLFFYGIMESNQTIAESPLSIADIAVVYRAVFHHGLNPPYISLDTHEDNRYAKVNFGGHLENTHVGHVVLEADKLFKTLCTGLHHKTYECLKHSMTQVIPDFLTEDERRFLKDSEGEHMQIRYWFYPDEISTVTNGEIGVIASSQFLANAERMGEEIELDYAIRKTISHLNENYARYELANNTFKELRTVGRVFALMNWLKNMEMNKRVELDELLSIKIPTFSTPEQTKKILAVSAIVHPSYVQISEKNVRNYTRTYSFSHLINTHPPNTSDREFLRIAGEFFEELETPELHPPELRSIQRELADIDRLMENNRARLESLHKQMEEKRRTLDMTNSLQIARYNRLVESHNKLLAENRIIINAYNTKVDEHNSMLKAITDSCFASISGGISLREFKQPVIYKDSPQINELLQVKSRVKPFEDFQRYGNWVRSNAEAGGARTNRLPQYTETWIRRN